MATEEFIASEPYWDPEIESMVIKKTENWIVSVSPMAFNDRVILMTQGDYPLGYTGRVVL